MTKNILKFFALMIAVSMTASVAHAGKGGGNGGGKGKPIRGDGSTLAVKMVNDLNSDGMPNWNDTVTFNIVTTAIQPTVNLECSQNGVLVYAAQGGFYERYPWPWTVNMTLMSGAWQSGAADCTAKLTTLGSNTILATLLFHANE